MGENLKDLFVNITGVKLTYHEPKSPMYPDTGVAKLKASARDALINGHTITGAQLGIGQDSDFEIRLNEAMVQDLQAALAKTAKRCIYLGVGRKQNFNWGASWWSYNWQNAEWGGSFGQRRITGNIHSAAGKWRGIKEKTTNDCVFNRGAN